MNGPTVTSFVRNDSTAVVPGTTVHYTITFSEPVTGVAAGAFSVATGGSTSAGSVALVAPVAGGDGSQYLVTVNTGSGEGSLQLILDHGGAIVDAGGRHLAGAFTGATAASTLLGNEYEVVPGGNYLSSYGIVVADMNGDGRADFVLARPPHVVSSYYTFGRYSSTLVSNYAPYGTTVLLGYANGSLAVSSNIDTPVGDRSATYGNYSPVFGSVVGDFNGDGAKDVVFWDPTAGGVQLFLGNGDGTLRAGTPLAPNTAIASAAAVDIDGDGKLDLLLMDMANNKLDLLSGNGDGTFQAPRVLGGAYGLQAIATADFNKDGRLDILAGSSMFLNNSDGSYTYKFASVNNSKQDHIGDVNGDGIPDIVDYIDLSNGNPYVTVNIGAGDGTFATTNLPTTLPLQSLQLADLNGDGRPDIVGVTKPSSGAYLYTFINNGNGTYRAEAVFNNVSGIASIAVGDVNGDGIADVTGIYSAGGIFVALGVGDGTFTFTKYANAAANSGQVQLADVNGDGYPDVVEIYDVVTGDLYNSTSTIKSLVLLNGPQGFSGPSYTLDTPPAVTGLTPSSTSAVLGTGQSATIAVNFGKAVAVSGGTPTLTLSDGGIATYDAAHSTAMSPAFAYTAAFGENSGALTIAGTNLNGATVKDAAGSAGDFSAAIGAATGLQVETTGQILFHNVADGRVASWHVNGATPVSKLVVDQSSTDWAFAGVEHPAGNLAIEVLQNSDGRVAVAQLNAFGHALPAQIVGVASSDWSLVGAGDLFHDGHEDFLWLNRDGRLAVWEMNAAGTAKVAEATIATPTSDWTFAGVGDFAGDGRTELLWRNVDGRVAEWTLGGTLNNPGISGQVVATPSADWRVAAVGDANGDGRDDIFFFNSDGRVALQEMNGSRPLGATQLLDSVTTDWSIVGARDFNGDGKADLVFHNTSGDVAIWTLDGAAITAKAIVDHASTDWHVYV